MDEDGEFWHLIIGAVIGGVVNWISHGCQFTWKGLGYFAVGAAAGALGAGVGAGISSALPIAGKAAGGFAAGFWGTSAATTATTSFFSGALIGGSSGLASGFTTGFGNSLIEGKNFGQALGQGGLYGAIGMGSGALIGGLWGGIDAAIDGRDFWDGSRVINNEVLSNASIPSVPQNNGMNCGPASSQSNTGVSQDAYRNHLVKKYGYGINDPVSPTDMGKSITDLTGRAVKPFATELPTDVIGAKQVSDLLNAGNRFMLSSGTGTAINHATALNKISVLTIQKISGSTFQKVVYQVMDPASGAFRNIGARSMDFIWRIFP